MTGPTMQTIEITPAEAQLWVKFVEAKIAAVSKRRPSPEREMVLAGYETFAAKLRKVAGDAVD